MQPGRRSTRDPQVYWCSWRVVVIGEWGPCCLVWRRFALPLTPSLFSFQKDCFVCPFFRLFFLSCRLMQGSRGFSCYARGCFLFRSTRDPQVYWCSWKVVVIGDGVLADLCGDGLCCLLLHHYWASQRIFFVNPFFFFLLVFFF